VTCPSPKTGPVFGEGSSEASGLFGAVERNLYATICSDLQKEIFLKLKGPQFEALLFEERKASG
jgi:hypothetical protein